MSWRKVGCCGHNDIEYLWLCIFMIESTIGIDIREEIILFAC